uniref:Uncharacterized protein n=1 Tax=Pithovirus LCPAC304 TaxID=2506594 RepID=A0A481Z8K3_9VIRU|nr:MAG: hypothetical protein LCPAC304_05900 [Pithovirus LCPAC304]
MTIKCTNGDLDGKILHLYDESEGLKVLFDSKFFDEDDPIVIDMTNHRIQTGSMEDVLEYLKTRNLNSFRSDGSFSGGSVVVAFEFFDKFILDEPSRELRKQLMEYLKPKQAMVAHLMLLMREWDVVDEEMYTFCLHQFCKNATSCKKFLIKNGIERTKSTGENHYKSVDSILKDVYALCPIPYDYVVVQSNSTEQFFENELFKHLLAVNEIVWVQSQDAETGIIWDKGNDDTARIHSMMTDLSTLGHSTTQCVVIEKVRFNRMMDVLTFIKNAGYDKIDCFEPPRVIYTTLGYNVAYIIAL